MRCAMDGRGFGCNPNESLFHGGSGEIRTHGWVTPSLVFKTSALNRSATLPGSWDCRWATCPSPGIPFARRHRASTLRAPPMTTRTTRIQALREALVLVIVLVAAVSAFVFVQHRPAGPDELKISIETLRSQVAELTLMNEQAGGAVPPRFLSAHATQLARAVGNVRDELQQMNPRPDLQSVREEGLAH